MLFITYQVKEYSGKHSLTAPMYRFSRKSLRKIQIFLSESSFQDHVLKVFTKSILDSWKSGNLKWLNWPWFRFCLSSF